MTAVPPSVSPHPMIEWLKQPLELLWSHRALLLQTVRNDLRARYAGSVLGTAWIIFYPLLLLGIYAAMYVLVFKVRFAAFSPTEYVALIFCGLIPFLGFSEALATGVISVTTNANLIKNTLFPIELIPVKAVLVSQCTQFVGTALLLVVLLVMGKLSAWLVLLPVVWALQILLSFGVIWALSSFNVIIRDLQNMLPVITMILMMISPIAYTADMVPSELRLVLCLNPLYYLIVSYQDCLMLSRFPRGIVFWLLLVGSLAAFWGGYWVFTRLKRIFADNV